MQPCINNFLEPCNPDCKHKLGCITNFYVNNGTLEYESLVLIEEQSELTKEICKKLRGKNRALSLTAEEMAHVKISWHVVKNMLGISDEEIDMFIQKKIDDVKKHLSEGDATPLYEKKK
jgi:hypothetical protein